MNEYQVTCVTRNDVNGRIIAIGGPGDGTGWTMTEAEAIRRIKRKEARFYTVVNGKRAEIGVCGTPPNEYLRTHADGYWNDNLDALGACPVFYRRVA